MKNALIVFLVLLFFSLNRFASAQSNATTIDSLQTDTSRYIVKTVAGREYLGKIISNDKREIVIQTTEIGEIAIPKYEIERISKLEDEDFNKAGSFVPDQVFATRYFITTNGLPIKKGENYVLWNLWGPDVNFGIADNWSIGLMTSWVGLPIIITTKYSIELNEKNNLGIGLLAGHTGWWSGALDGGGGGLLPFATYTYGTRKSNISASLGYAFVYGGGESGGAALLSLAGVAYMSRKVSFVFDSWIIPYVADESLALLMPGLRFQTREKSAFQFALSGVITSEGTIPVPIPFIQWFKRF